jgi:hypothetical protein
MIAFQVGGKATRDALFLSLFPVTALPAMLATSAALSILAVLATSKLMSSKGPAAVIPAAFGASSILLLFGWLAFPIAPRAVAVLLYMHMAAFGAILISGFWSIISELFDPRTAKATIGQIAAGATLGGVFGGLLAERTGTMFSVTSMLPVLAALHLICALLNRRLRAVMPLVLSEPSRSEMVFPAPRSGFGVLREVPYVKYLAALVLLGTVAETLLDYVLKMQAAAAFTQGRQLIRFFALFYTGIGLATFLVQAAFSRYSLQRFGLKATLSTMPIAVVAGGISSVIWPGLSSIALARGAQSVFASSLFRSGYELLYSPIIRAEKRAAKTIVDVGFDRLGDAIGAGLIRILLALGLAAAVNTRILTIFAVALGIVSLFLTARLSMRYVGALETSLLHQAAELDLPDVEERTTRATMLRTLGTIDLSAIRLPQQAEALPIAIPAAQPASTMRRLLSLQAESTWVVREALGAPAALDPLLVAPVIRLLARDDVSELALKALRANVAEIVGQLTDALLNPEEDFAVRRRIPRVLAHCPSPRAVDGLMRGLADSRFEVRLNCVRALSRICSADPSLRPPSQSVYDAALKELKLTERLSEAPRVLDPDADAAELPSSDGFWKSADIRLEHIFRLLSLTLPSEPLHVALQALHTEDAYLRGTALEYLESILPADIREHLWNFLEGPTRPAAVRKPAEHVLAELMKSRERIELKFSNAPKGRFPRR